jgi:signal transduction histidine kinase
MWREPVKKLINLLESHDEYNQLIISIDKAIAKSDLRPSKLFEEFKRAIKYLTNELKCNASALYIRNGEHGYIMSITEGSFNWPSMLNMDGIISDLDRCCDSPHHISNIDIMALDLKVEKSTSGLIAGVAGDQGCDAKSQFAVFFFLREGFDSKIVWEEEALRKLKTVCVQLSNGYRFAITEQKEAILEKIVERFFEEEMDAQKCLNVFSYYCKDLFPSFYPLSVAGNIKTQLLLWDPSQDSSLTIKATTGEDEGKSEPIGSLVDIKNSITGKLIINPDLSYYICNPQQEAGTYVPYLGKTMKSELAIPVNLIEYCSASGEQCKAIINFESETENAFSSYHIDYITKYFREGQIFQKMVDALLVQQRKYERSVGAAFQTLQDYTGYWVNMFSHSVGNKINPIKTNIFSVERRLSKDTEINNDSREFIEEGLREISRSMDQLQEIHNQYCQLLIDVPRFEKRHIHKIIENALSMMKVDGLKNSQGIELNYENNNCDHLLVKTTPMLSQHIYNIIDNSIFWIRKKKEKLQERGNNTYQGEINIRLEEVAPYLDNEKHVNRYCKISIHDNGSGANQYILSKLRDGDKQFTTRVQGNGVGVFSMTQYVRSIGGTVSINSEEGESFLVSITLPLAFE